MQTESAYIWIEQFQEKLEFKLASMTNKDEGYEESER